MLLHSLGCGEGEPKVLWQVTQKGCSEDRKLLREALCYCAIYCSLLCSFFFFFLQYGLILFFFFILFYFMSCLNEKPMT